MTLGIIVQAAGLFAATNIDDFVVLTLFFAQGAGHKNSTRTIATGQYLGFALILCLAAAAAIGATFLAKSAIPYLGLLPLVLGLKAARQAWRDHRNRAAETQAKEGGPKMLKVAAVTFANGGDNIGVYVPVFATAGLGTMSVYVPVFLILLAAWIFACKLFATRPLIARALARWGHILPPVALIGIGLLLLIQGGAFGR